MVLGKVLVMVLVLVLVVLGLLFFGVQVGDCKGQWQVLWEVLGFVMDGVGNYSVNGNCEWFIEVLSFQYWILLDFFFLDIECMYDYLFVYDGDFL